MEFQELFFNLNNESIEAILTSEHAMDIDLCLDNLFSAVSLIKPVKELGALLMKLYSVWGEDSKSRIYATFKQFLFHKPLLLQTENLAPMMIVQYISELIDFEDLLNEFTLISPTGIDAFVVLANAGEYFKAISKEKYDLLYSTLDPEQKEYLSVSCDRDYEISNVLMNDDVDKLLELMEDPGFNIDGSVPFSPFHVNRLMCASPRILQAAAFYGAVQCFELLDVSGARMFAMDRHNNTLVYYAYAGGSMPIIHRVLHRRPLTLESIGVIHFHRSEIFSMIADQYTEEELMQGIIHNNLMAELRCKSEDALIYASVYGNWQVIIASSIAEDLQRRVLETAAQYNQWILLEKVSHLFKAIDPEPLRKIAESYESNEFLSTLQFTSSL